MSHLLVQCPDAVRVIGGHHAGTIPAAGKAGGPGGSPRGFPDRASNRRCYVESTMRERARNGAAIVIAGLGVMLGIQALTAPHIAFTGITLRREGDPAVLVVAAVDPATPYHGDI